MNNTMNNNAMGAKGANLLYNYAVLDENYRCTGCGTYSYQVPLDNFIPVPDARDEYVGTYYNPSTDLWYEDASYNILATEVNEMYHG